MTPLRFCRCCCALAACLGAPASAHQYGEQITADDRRLVSAKLPSQNVIWTTKGSNSPRQGMPFGNGTYGGLVWVHGNNTIYILLGAQTFWDGWVRQRIPGRIKITFSRDVLTSSFRQELKLKEGEIVITGSGGSVGSETRIWADAHAPAIHIESRRTSGSATYDMTVGFENLNPSTVVGSRKWFNFYDTMDFQYLPGQWKDPTPNGVPMANAYSVSHDSSGIRWWQRNDSSFFDEITELQGLRAANYADPLTGRTFGGLLQGAGFSTEGTPDSNGGSIKRTGQTSYRAAVTLHSKISTAAQWETEIKALSTIASNIGQRRTRHRLWWSNFWHHSYIFASGTAHSVNAANLTQKYAIARYLQATASRTPGIPKRFNGSMYTWEPDGGDISLRPWNSFHMFNQRFVYWGMLPGGDFQLMHPHFDLFINSLKLAKDRVAVWWSSRGSQGAMWPEVVGLWGHSVGGEYGWDRYSYLGGARLTSKIPVHHIKGVYTRHLYTGNIETAAQMIDYYDYTRDATYFREKLLPVIRGIVRFYFTHWGLRNGKLSMSGVYSGEVDRNLTNPTADMAGLRKVLESLIRLGANCNLSPGDLAYFSARLAEVPPIPINATYGFQTAASLVRGRENNNQNLYPLFPMRLYGYQNVIDGDASSWAVANRSYQRRFGNYPDSGFFAGWRHDGTHSAYLGLVDESVRQVNLSLGRAPASGWRFIGFPASGVAGNPGDGYPGVEQPAIGRITFQAMLLHPSRAGDKSLLFNAWPAGWSVDFKLHAPNRTIVRGSGSLRGPTTYSTHPPSRRASVVVRAAPSE